MSAGRHLVLRRGGRLWGVPESAVVRVLRDAGGVTVEAGGTLLAAEEVLGMHALAGSRSVGVLTGRFVHGTYDGFAVFDGEPVILVDPRRAPRELRAPGVPARHDEDDDRPDPAGNG